jgi:hypothetical protein
MAALAAQVGSAATKSTGSDLTFAQLHQNFRRDYRAAINDLGTYLRQQASELFQNGPPTSTQIRDFRSLIQGAVDATAFRVVSEASLLPGSSSLLVPSIENSLIGPGRLQLVNRLVHVTMNTSNLESPASLQNALNRQLATAVSRASAQSANPFNFTLPQLPRTSITDNQTVSFSQLVSQRIVSQFENSLGAFAQAFPAVANSMLFANGATSGNLTALDTFGQQFTSALGTIGFQLSNDMGILGANVRKQMLPEFQSMLFASVVCQSDEILSRAALALRTFSRITSAFAVQTNALALSL